MGDRGSSHIGATWSQLIQPKNRYRVTPGVRHSGIVHWLIIYYFTNTLRFLTIPPRSYNQHKQNIVVWLIILDNDNCILYHRCSEGSNRSLLFLKRTRSFMFFSILFSANVSERKFCYLPYTICMNMYENIQHSMGICDEIFILWYSIFLNLSINWHLEIRYSNELFVMCHYYITRSFARSFTFFIIF